MVLFGSRMAVSRTTLQKAGDLSVDATHSVPLHSGMSQPTSNNSTMDP